MKPTKYLLYKDKKDNEIIYIEYTENKSFKLKPKNKLEKYLSVEKLIMISPDFVKKVIHKRVEKKIGFLVSEMHHLSIDEDADEGGIKFLIQECETLKMKCVNEYFEYLSNEEIKEIFSKVEFIYNKIKDMHYSFLEANTKGRSR